MELKRVGVDLAKHVFQVHGVDRREKPVWQKRLSRGRWGRTRKCPGAQSTKERWGTGARIAHYGRASTNRCRR